MNYRITLSIFALCSAAVTLRTPSSKSASTLAMKERDFVLAQNPTHIGLRDARTVERMLREAGFDVERSEWRPSFFRGLRAVERVGGRRLSSRPRQGESVPWRVHDALEFGNEVAGNHAALSCTRRAIARFGVNEHARRRGERVDRARALVLADDAQLQARRAGVDDQDVAGQ